MYTGHIGLALGAKGFQRQVNLWLLCIAASAPDLVDFSAQMFRIDTSLWTHTLPGMAGAAVLFFAVGWVLTRSVIASVVTGLLAASHMTADLLTSRLRLWPGGPVAGLHWYLRPTLDFSIETFIVLVGWLLYGRSLPASKRFSPASIAIVVILLALQAYMATLNIS